MASTSKIRNSAEDEVEQEIERFDDFTLASSWERFISEIEAVCRRWLSDGPKNLLEKGAVLEGLSKKLYKAKSEFKYSAKNYFMEYYFEAKHTGKGKIWESTLHDIQLSFGVNEFLVIAPQSASGVVLDSPEASKLLSAVAIALSNCSSHWPAFVPVHDPSRKAYIGIQNMGTIFTRRFEADQIGSQVPVKLMHLEGLYELFVSKFAFSADFSLHLFKVQFTMKLTYRTLPDNEEDDYMQEADDEGTESSVDMGAEPHHRKQWDDDCPWSEWYSAENPVKGYELIAIWSEKTIERSLEMAEVENSSPHEAETWLLLPTFSEILSDDSKSSVVGFASQLSLLVKALEMSFEAQFLEDFVSVESGSDNLKASAAIPPPSVVDRVLKDLFQEGPKMPDFAKGEHKCSRAIKGAPLESLFAQFCLHSLWFGNCNIRAIAMLWIEFIREVRWCWEESQLLPKMLPEGVIDLSTCLINQKLQMLAICIEKKREANQVFYDATEDKDALDHSDMEEDEVKEKSIYEKASSAGSHKKKDRPDKLHDSVATNDKANKVMMSTDPADRLRRGSVGVVGSMMLLNSSQKMHAPFTQEAPLMTEDMHEERIRAIEAFGDSINFSAQLEREVLLSVMGAVYFCAPDMSAFKAANPDAIFEDFIRWHSPGDWENDVTNESQSLRTKPDDDWPPRGHLSKRMSDQGNFWRQLWNDAPAIPASDQKLLLDPNREGEKSALLSAVYLENGRPVGSFTVLHYLETLRPHQLLEQMVCTAFRASADTLNQTTYGDFNQLKTRLEQLYRTLASGLRPLQANRLSHDTENFKDLSRLSVVFKNVEKFVHLAASLHRKFIRVPRLSKAILSDYCNFYLLGSSREFSKEFDLRQQVRLEERHIVVDMFPPPTANQSWRKVLSMGNLLNGHEPIIREIIFSMRDTVSGNHYSACGPSGLHDEIETYRMYISGSSNDLQVALSVVSCD